MDRRGIFIDGFAYRLRPVKLSDAEFIIEARLEDEDRNQFIHKISSDVEVQKKWLQDYLQKEDDHYFVIENKLNSKPEGLIAIYNIQDGSAEWGRWVIKKGSLAAIESVDLIYKAAFNILKLNELFCRTIKDNTLTVSFHNSIKQKQRAVLEKFVSINNKFYDCIEHYVDSNYYFESIQNTLESKSHLIFQRNFKQLVGELKFHHIGIATSNIESEFAGYKMLGYNREGNKFEDKEQGIKGLFIVAKNQPRLELLENLNSESHTLDYWIKNKVKAYHFAYLVQDIEKIVETLNQNKVKLISPLKMSSYFKKRICFLVLSNMFMIELIEE
jgi:RimJ/RimL family protein N-acetyltransferase